MTNPPVAPPVPEEAGTTTSSFTIDAEGKKKWDVVEVDNQTDSNNWSFQNDWKFDPLGTKVIHSLEEPLPWEKAIGVHTTEDGSELFFVELEGMGIVALKGSLTIASDVFANDLALLAGMEDVPQMKLVCEKQDPQWDSMVEVLWKLEATKRSPELSQENATSKLAKSLHNRSSFILMEFVKGHDLQSLLGEEEGNYLKRVLKKENVLNSIGQIIAFDLFVNNWDRFPFVWRNDGNAKNIMVNLQKERVFGIDHTFTSIDPQVFPDNCNQYLTQVSEALDEIIKNPLKESEATSRVRSFIKNNTNVDIGETGSVYIQKGILDCVCRMGELNIKEMLKVKKAIERRITPTTEEYGLPEESVGLNRIVPDFLEEIHQLFEKKVDQIRGSK